MNEAAWKAHHYDRCFAWIEAALEECPIRTHEMGHVWEAIRDGGAQIWPGDNSVVVTVISDHPTGIKTVCCWLGGGEINEIREIVDTISVWANRQGASHLTIQGRKGWSRALGGWKAASALSYKEVNP